MLNPDTPLVTTVVCVCVCVHGARRGERMRVNTCGGYGEQRLRVLAADTAVQFNVVLSGGPEAGHDRGARVSGQSAAHGPRGRGRLSDLYDKVLESLLSRLPGQREAV